MKKNHLHFFFLALTIFLMSCGGKENQEKKQLKYEEFVIKVDSFSAPDSLMLNQKARLRFWGSVGPNNSYKFDRFSVIQDSVRTQVMLIGRHELYPKGIDSSEVFLQDCHYDLIVKDSMQTKLEILNPGHQQRLKKQFVIF